MLIACAVLTFGLLFFKLVGHLDWSWWIITSPTWAPTLVVLLWACFQKLRVATNRELERMLEEMMKR